MKKCAFYMMIGALMALAYKTYEKEIICMCNKMMKKEREIIETGLDIE